MKVLYWSSFALALMIAQQARAQTPDRKFKIEFKNPAELALFTKGQTVQNRLNACLKTPGPHCSFSVEDFTTLKKFGPLFKKAVQAYADRYLVYEVQSVRDTDERNLQQYSKELAKDRQALRDYRSHHPVLAVVSQIPGLQNISNIGELQTHLDTATQESTSEQWEIKDVDVQLKAAESVAAADQDIRAVPAQANAGRIK